MRNTTQNFAHSAKHLSKRLVFTYVLDWILVLATVGVGAAFSKINGNRHAFSLDDPSISYPYKVHETVTFTTLMLASVVAPGIIILLIALIFTPKPNTTGKSHIWRHKLSEWNKAWLGLGLSLAGAFFLTEGLKDLTGKPRPDLLARCLPDIANARQDAVGGLGFQFAAAPVIVDWHICTQNSSSTLADGFASFPSGHSSFAWAGLGYLSLFLCARFGIAAPVSRLNKNKAAAAPPYYQLIIAFVPLGVAFFIADSRWADYRHHGFDVISGSLIGAVFAWLGFWWYHLPARVGTYWASGAKNDDLEDQPERNREEATGLYDVDGAASPIQQDTRQL